MTTPFRLGIIGTGLIVQESHLPACLACSDVNVAALVDSEPGRAADCAKRFGISPRILTRAEDLAGLVDGVLIATPDHSHRELAVTCLNARIPVLVEKPLAPTDEDCERIREASARSGTLVAVGYNFRFWPSIELVTELLSSRALGAPRMFVMQFGSAGGWAPLSAYYVKSKASGAMSINGSHYLERVLHWFGAPREMRYFDDSCGGPEANAVASMAWEGLEGVVCVSRTTKIAPGCAIETDLGLLVHRDWQDPIVEFVPHASMGTCFAVRRKDCSIAGRPDIFVLQIRDFVSACRSGRSPRVTLERGAEVTRLINSLYSCREPLDTAWYSTNPASGVLQ